LDNGVCYEYRCIVGREYNECFKHKKYNMRGGWAFYQPFFFGWRNQACF